MKKKIVIGWITRNHKFNFKRERTSYGDKLNIIIQRGNPNPTNYTKTNHWEKVKITIEKYEDKKCNSEDRK